MKGLTSPHFPFIIIGRRCKQNENWSNRLWINCNIYPLYPSSGFPPNSQIFRRYTANIGGWNYRKTVWKLRRRHRYSNCSCCIASGIACRIGIRSLWRKAQIDLKEREVKTFFYFFKF